MVAGKQREQQRMGEEKEGESEVPISPSRAYNQ
jgi:hypothetical protein